MDLIFFIPIAMFLIVAAFEAGKWSKEHPSEEEMMRRIVESRMRERLEAKVEEEVAAEISRRTARS